jgi:hypothetical protein
MLLIVLILQKSRSFTQNNCFKILNISLMIECARLMAQGTEGSCRLFDPEGSVYKFWHHA